MSNNTTTKYPSHFPKAISLIEGALNQYDLHTENWSYPSEYRFGIPKDEYYAEVWHNGMDWQSNYFLIETSNFSPPTCVPLIVFEDDRPHRVDFKYFSDLVNACLHYRREITWFGKQNGDQYYHDQVWPFVWKFSPEIHKHKVMLKMGMCLADQRPVEFLINENCVPLNNIQIGRPAGVREPVNYSKIINSIMRKKELIPLLMNIDSELDELIEQELRKVLPS